MEAQLLTGVRLGVGLGGVRLQTVEEIDLLRGLSLPRQLAQRLDCAGLDAAEAMELEGTTQDVDEVLLDDAARREPLGKAGQ